MGYLHGVTEDFETGTAIKKNPASYMVETLNPGPPDYNTRALNHSAPLSPVYHYRRTIPLS